MIPVLTLAIGAAAIAGCGGTPSSHASQPKSTASTASTPATSTTDAASGRIKVDLGEWNVTPSAATATAGKVTFDVTNSGKLKHEFVVLKTDKPAASLGHGSRVPEDGNVGEAGDLAAGAHKSVTLNLKPGHYVLVCNLPGHYMAGMRKDFTVS